MTADLLELAHERSARGEPFVMATVVWRRAPSSGRPGSKALIAADGSVSGWLGGACAEPAVVREALRALGDGAPRLMFIGPAEELEGAARPDVVTVPIACQSEGALEVYLEPVLPRPHLVAIGRSPAAGALAAMARALGWRAVQVEDDLDAAAIGEGSLVVVATQGHFDEDALEHALARRPAYLALVASRRRAEAVLAYLRSRGVPERDIARVRSPAGLDLGHVAPEEISVAVLAEIVALRAAGELRAVPGLAPVPEEAVDPVCGMTVAVAASRYRTERGGRTYHFCSAGCLERFEAETAARTGS